MIDQIWCYLFEVICTARLSLSPIGMMSYQTHPYSSTGAFEMESEDSDYLQPFDDELEAALIAAEDIVARAKAVDLVKLEFVIQDESGEWSITVKKSGVVIEDKAPRYTN